MPHVGHADSITNDERGSRLDISDWSSSNPVTRVIKVILPTSTISFYIIIHTFIHAFILYARGPRTIRALNRPGARKLRHHTCGEMHHNAPCCITKR